MVNLSYGDLGASLRNMRLTSQIKKDLDKYNFEVASGDKSNLKAAVSGDFGPLASLEYSIRSLAAYQDSLREAEFFASSLQSVLGTVGDNVERVTADLLMSSGAGDSVSLNIVAKDARGTLDTLVSALNSRAAGRALLGGTATGSPPLANAEEILADLTTSVSSETTASGVLAAVDQWFDASGGGFEITAYKGSANELAPLALNERERATFGLKADDPAIREVLKGFAIASLVTEGVLSNDPSEQSRLVRASAETLMSSEAKIADIRAQLGLTEEQISDAKAANGAETYALQMAKSEIMSADIYESASMLTQTQTQLEMMYTLTARLSRLKLSDYL